MSVHDNVIGGVTVTPMLLADLFWNMDCEEQADFFAALERIAGHKLCIQMSWVLGEIEKRSQRGDHDAQNGFQTMLSHAQSYVEGAIDSRAWRAKWDIDRMVDLAKGTQA